MSQRLKEAKPRHRFAASFVIVLLGLNMLVFGNTGKTAHAQALVTDPQPLRITGTTFNATNGSSTDGVHSSNNVVGSVDAGDWVRYDNVNLSGYTNLTIDAAVVSSIAQIDAYVDMTESGATLSGGTLIGTFSNMGTNGSYTTFTTRSILLSHIVTGTHSLYLKFHAANNSMVYGLLNYDWLQFSRDYYADADLQNVTVSTGTISPIFNKSVTAYILIVYGTTSQVDLTAQVDDTGFATLQINGTSQADNTALTIPVSQPQSITITVTAENGTQKTYTVTVQHHSQLDPQPLRITGTTFNATNGLHTDGVHSSNNVVGSVDAGDWVRYDNVNLSGYTNLTIDAAVVSSIAQIDVYVDMTESGATLSGGTLIGTFSNMGTNGSYNTFTTRSILLSHIMTGTHSLYLKFYQADGSTAFGLLNYDWLQFSRDYYADADLQNLTLSVGDLSPATFSKSVTAYTLVVYGNVTQVDVTAQVDDPGYATLQINGASQADNTALTLSISQAQNIVITVTAEDGTQKDYTITIEHRNLYQDYYVDPVAGTDVNTGSNGTATSPWQTLTFACNNVPRNAGVTIHLVAGIFPMSTPCLLPLDTNLVGAGTNQTTITPTITYDPQGHMYNNGANYFAIQVTGSSNASISNLKMDGQINSTTRAHGGILAHNVSNFNIHDVELDNFNYTAAWITNADNTNFYNAVVNESGYTLDNSSTAGNIMMGDLSNSSIHDVTIREDKGAYGIKGWKYTSTGTTVDGADSFVDVSFYHLDMKLRQMGAWNNGASPNFGIELWGSSTNGVDIFQSSFNGTLSFPQASTHSSPINTIHVHDNLFVGDTTTIGTTYTYFIEASTDYMEIDHNLFQNAVYPIASFGSNVVGQNIHHNIFYNVYGVSVLNYNTVQNLQFNYNAVIINGNVRSQERGHLPVFQLGAGASNYITVTNNLFADITEPNQGAMFYLAPNTTNPPSLGSNVTVDSNAFCNWTASGTNALSF